MMVLDRLDTQGGRNVGFTGAGSADQDDVVGIIEKVTAMQLTHERLVDLAAGEVKAVQIAIGWKASCLELIGCRSDLTFRSLGLEKLRQDRNCGLESWCRFMFETGTHAVSDFSVLREIEV